MLFNYSAIDKDNSKQEGSIDAVSEDVAISALQRRGLTILSIEAADKKSIFSRNIKFLSRVPTRDVVILSRQIATLFDAQVSALKVFRLLASEVENKLLQEKLHDIATNIQGGSTISGAMEKHPDVFSSFYVNMVKAGEESGKLSQTFLYLADYLDRNYELTSKAKNALIYPTFVIVTFVAVMVLMLTSVIPKISTILLEAGQDIPIYTKIVIAISNFFVNFGFLLLVLLILGGFFLWRYIQSEAGKYAFANFKIKIPYLGDLYRKLYLSRIADNLNTMLSSGIPVVRAVEITADVVDNDVYKKALLESLESIKGGHTVAESFGDHEVMPAIMVQMVRIGEETGELGNILSTLATFYRREVENAVDTLVGLIEPAMIVLLGVGVGTLLASVLIPIYNISSAI